MSRISRVKRGPAKVLALVTAAFFMLAACSSGGSSEEGAGGGQDTGSGEAGGLITIIVNDPSNPYWKTEGDIASAAAEDLGYDTTVGAHEGDRNKENNLIDTAISNQSEAIILDPQDADGSIGAVQKAIDADI